ncbi:MAG: amidophosphoribosyltransferase [Bacteroidales bacterium]|nr:amidophosphoribosyltransferase [Bacteroidales bacterium]
MEELKHECGVALIRLLKPLEYYRQKYGTLRYGVNKLYLMLEKEHNRGQEGAGIACADIDAPPGSEYMFRERSESKDAITEIFNRVGDGFRGQLYMGHLRYSTTGKKGISYVHPFLRRNNWRARNLCVCGNFNITNFEEIFEDMVGQGQYPRIYSDSYITLERMGHRLDMEVERNFADAKAKGLKGLEVTDYIDNNVKIENVLKTSLADYDGGYVMCGLTGSGEMFAVRDPWGIRPAFYYQDDEIVALASERPVLQTVFNLDCEDVNELPAGHALIVRKNGECVVPEIFESKGNFKCSFERIYFSRGSDRDIYRERKKLGELLVDPVFEAVGHDVENTVFSFIPNTAEVAFYGLVGGFRRRGMDVRIEKVAWKDIKLRTFITEAGSRDDLASHVYDITYGSLTPGEDNLVIIDDSIVRGTTLKDSILKILDRLRPKKIVIVSSSPQIRYPDYYGIDMPRLEEFCAFQATMELWRKSGKTDKLKEILEACKEELTKPKEEMVNRVREVYKPFTVKEINDEMVRMLRPAGMVAPVELVFQSTEGLREACPDHPGDWYFTGKYPTPGGNKRVNEAFVDYMTRNSNI